MFHKKYSLARRILIFPIRIILFFPRLIWRLIKRIFCDPNIPGTGAISPNNPCCKTNKIRLVRCSDTIIGKGMHRSGWPFVFRHLETVNSNNGILFDDFVEQTFCYVDNSKPYTQPWVGVFHHPPNPPCFSNSRESLRLMFRNNRAFRQSLPHLKFAITLSDYLGDFLEKELKTKVLRLKHPIGAPVQGWCPKRYVENKHKSIIQVGFYLRNTHLLYQFSDICGFNKYKPALNKEWMKTWDARVKDHWYKLDIRPEFKTRVKYYNFVAPSQYDDLLSQNVIAMEFFDVSAANGILDCIARNTPILVNRHPATVEYLGKDYPLFFDNPQQIPSLISKAVEAHYYLKNMDKSWMSGELFVSRIVDALERSK